MNTNPDDEKLALWLDDELDGPELATMDSSFSGNPEWVEMREENRRWKNWVSEHAMVAAEPACADFFNARILRSIERVEGVVAEPRAGGATGWGWRAWFMPLAAAAGIVVGFQFGARKPATQSAGIDVSGAPKAIPVEPILYTPENGVKASWFDSRGADAYVIVLDGVPAIPDAVDFTRAMSASEPDIDEKAMVEMSWEASEKPPGSGS